MDVELNNLTETERDAIANVLRRDEELRKKEMDRIRKLRTDVKRIRMKGVIKSGHDPMKTCARCREPFGWLFNKGSICPKCQHKVCDKCRQSLSKVSNVWVCILCFKLKELDAQTNKWFYTQFRKSKRNKKTNNVVTGGEIVRASMRRARRDATSGSGSDGGRSSIGDEIKRVLSNNNASPKSRRANSQSAATAADEPGESSDTQSMGTASSPRHRKHHPREVSDVTYPKDSDRQKLMDLIRPKSADEVERSPQHEVKRVVSRKYSESESSTSGSEPSSPNISTRPDSSFGYSDSVRSSIRSSSAVSSDGRMTIVTESCISDIDTISMMSEMPQETPIMVPQANQEKVTSAIHLSPSTSVHSGGGRSSSEVTNVPPRSGSNTFKSSDSVIDHPSHSSQIVNSNSTLDEYEPAETVVVHKVINNRRQDSMSSDSEDDFTTEQITKVKFRRVSKKGQRSRSPSPESRQGQPSSKTSTPKPSKDKQSGGAVKVVHKQQKVQREEDQAQQQLGEEQHLLGGNKASHPVKEYGETVSPEGQTDLEAKRGPSSDSDYRTSESPVHTDDANTKPEVPSLLIVQHDESSGVSAVDGQLSTDESNLREDASSAQAPPSGEPGDIKAETALAVSSSKPGRVASAEDDGLEEDIAVDEDDLQNIDDIVASHQTSVKSTPTRSTRSTAPVNRSTGNLLSSFSASKESIASYYSDAGEGNYGTVAVTGEIQFGLDYNYKTGSLEIAVKQCRDLAAVDKKKNRSDPYVKTYLLPDKTKGGKRKTRAKKHSLNPTFDELLKYQITKSELETRTLWISVWNNDTFGRNDFLGEVSIPLDYYAFDDSSPQWYKLQDRGLRSKIKKLGKELPKPSYMTSHESLPPAPPTSALKHPDSSPPGNLTKQKSKSVSFLDTPHLPKLVGSPFQEWSSDTNSSSMALITYKGDLIILLKFVTSDNASSKKSKGGGKSRGELHVLIKEARNLTAVRSNGTSDPFCKGYLLPEKTRGTKQKTPVVKRNVNPQWNHTFVFEDVSLDDLRERSIELTVWDHDRFTSNDFLGGVRLNLGTGRCGGKDVDWMDARGEEISIWQNMLERPNAWSEASLMLRHTMAKRL